MSIATLGRFSYGAGAVADAVLMSPEIPADPNACEPRCDRVRVAIKGCVNAIERIVEKVTATGPA